MKDLSDMTPDELLRHMELLSELEGKLLRYMQALDRFPPIAPSSLASLSETEAQERLKTAAEIRELGTELAVLSPVIEGFARGEPLPSEAEMRQVRRKTMGMFINLLERRIREAPSTEDRASLKRELDKFRETCNEIEESWRRADSQRN